MKTLLVLAGGFGSRLRSVVSEVPKPLAPVCGEPFLKYFIKNCISQDIEDVVFLIHYHANQIQDLIDDIRESETAQNIRLRTIEETEPLGTGGAIFNAIEQLNLRDSFLVMNADTWIGSGFKLINDAGAPSVAAVEIKNCDRYGSLEIKDGLVTNFKEKKILGEAGVINAGLYHLSPSDFEGQWSGKSFSLEKEIIPKLVEEKILKAVHIKANFIDIGIPEDYLRFCKWIELGENGEL